MFMIPIKQGDTLGLFVFYKDDDGEGANLEDVIVEADIKLRTARVHFRVVKYDQAVHPGKFTLTIEKDVTVTLPKGPYDCDIKYTAEDATVRTESFVIQVLEAVTL